MNIIQLAYSDVNGGASRASYRIHQALCQHGLHSRLWADAVTSGDWTVRGHTTKLHKSLARLRPSLASGLVKQVFTTKNLVIHSPSILPSGRIDALNNSGAEIVHLHWVQSEMLSIADIGKLRKPVVWTLHDMWAFCGAEHYTEDCRWREGYTKDNRPSYESGFDLNRWTWVRKRRHWQRPMQIVTPSNWLAQCVRESALMRDWPVCVIPNPIDTGRWHPLEQMLARELLSLPKEVPLLLFGAIGGSKDPRKGFDLLQAALQHLRGSFPKLQLVIFGELCPESPPDLGFPIHYVGHLHDDLTLRVLYSAADAFILPSRQDNLPNTAVESLACGTPIVAFDTCGLPDVVIHQETGYLAKAFDVEDLARGIQWTLLDRGRHAQLRANARAHAIKHFSSEVVSAQYQKIYEAAIAVQKN